jgi:hypothetical protein
MADVVQMESKQGDQSILRPYEQILSSSKDRDLRRQGIWIATRRLRAAFELPDLPVHQVVYPDALEHLSYPLLVKAFYAAEAGFSFWPKPKDILSKVAHLIDAENQQEWAHMLGWLLKNIKRHTWRWIDKPGRLDYDEATRKAIEGPPIPPPQIPPAMIYALEAVGGGDWKRGLKWLDDGHPFFYSQEEWMANFKTDARNAERDMGAELRKNWLAAREIGLAWRVDELGEGLDTPKG